MSAGDLLTRGTIWLALGLYIAGELAAPCERNEARARAHRWLKTLGAAAFLAHVACAFHFHHGWSHAAALAETARQTAELTGWGWGGGLYVNYAFALVWIGDAVAAWTASSGQCVLSRWWALVVRGSFLFMMVNGAVVFTRGVGRVLGAMLCVALLACWLHRARRGADRPAGAQPP